MRATTVFISGVLLVVGALIGGGCTTGAFLSGWPTLSIGSFATAGTFFGTAILVSHLLFVGRYQLVNKVKEEMARLQQYMAS